MNYSVFFILIIKILPQMYKFRVRHLAITSKEKAEENEAGKSQPYKSIWPREVYSS